MSGLFDHLLFLTLAVALPALAFLFVHRRLERVPLEELPLVRVRAYWRVIAMQWTLVAVLASAWLVRGRDWGELGLQPGRGWAAAGIWVVAVAAGAFLIVQGRALLASPGHWDRLRGRLLGLWRLLPATRPQWALFVAVSATAGICEEVLYRGFAIAYLGNWLPAYGAALVASAAFGLGHAYQGPRGILLTAALGVAFATLYLVSGTLWPVMLLHAVIDANSGWIVYRIAATRGPHWVIEPPLPAEPGGPPSAEPPATIPQPLPEREV